VRRRNCDTCHSNGCGPRLEPIHTFAMHYYLLVWPLHRDWHRVPETPPGTSAPAVPSLHKPITSSAQRRKSPPMHSIMHHASARTLARLHAPVERRTASSIQPPALVNPHTHARIAIKHNVVIPHLRSLEEVPSRYAFSRGRAGVRVVDKNYCRAAVKKRRTTRGG
jgi:hypothetical protein